MLVVAFLVWLLVAIWTGASSGEPSTETTTGPEPTPAPPDPELERRLAATERKLASSRRARRRDLYRYRHALRVIVRQDVIGDHWLERGFRCVHGFEGPWDDPNAPYYGGLQMDLDFQRGYGPEFLRAFGTADQWPRSVQVAVAIRAYLAGRGFYPWPNTARACGLIR